jgi:serine/threonine-protein kinase
MGAVLFEMLTGQVDRTNLAKALSQFPHSILTCIETACAANPDDRFKSADDFIRALGGTQQILAPMLEPALAICVNPKCRGADWSPNGFYRGPMIIDTSTNSFCTECGEALKYRCDECGAPIANARHCGNCGHETYTVPTCEKCGSFLKSKDMGLDTSNGCTKCLGKKPAAKTVEDLDDDIPF